MGTSQFAASFFVPGDKLETHAKAKSCTCLLAYLTGLSLGLWEEAVQVWGWLVTALDSRRKSRKEKRAHFLHGWDRTLLGARENTDLKKMYMREHLVGSR